VIAISSDRPSGLQQSLRKHDLGYTLLSDSGMRAARAFGIAWQVDDDGIAMYKRYGIDLEKASGETHHQLPVPSVFLVGRDGRIQYVFSNSDYKIRPDNDTLLRAAREAGGRAARRNRAQSDSEAAEVESAPPTGGGRAVARGTGRIRGTVIQ